VVDRAAQRHGHRIADWRSVAAAAFVGISAIWVGSAYVADPPDNACRPVWKAEILTGSHGNCGDTMLGRTLLTVGLLVFAWRLLTADGRAPGQGWWSVARVVGLSVTLVAVLHTNAIRT
jgi:hypothetical protein